jgi:capsular polysaccharide biosynthesis protein
MENINFFELLKHFVKYWRTILACSFAGLVAGLIYTSYLQVPLYKSDATILVVDSTGSSSTKDLTRINNFLQLIKSRRVIDPVITKVDPTLSYQAVYDSIATKNDKDTEVIKLSITSETAAKSKQLVNEVIASFQSEVKDIYNLDNIKVVDSASTPSEPFNVKTAFTIALATLGSLAISLVCIFIHFDYIHSSNYKPKPLQLKKRISLKSIFSGLAKKGSEKPAVVKTTKIKKKQIAKQQPKKMTQQEYLDKLLSDTIEE